MRKALGKTLDCWTKRKKVITFRHLELGGNCDGHLSNIFRAREQMIDG